MRTSSRLPGSLAPNAFSAALAELRRGGAPLLDLGISNPTACGFAYPEGSIREALAQPGVLSYRPDPSGPLAAREAVARWHGHGTRPDEVFLAASTSEAYAWLFKLLGDPGDHVLVPSPSYPLFEWLARLEGLEARPVPAFLHERWCLDLQGLEEACTPRTRAVVVVNPNNPTGQRLSVQEWEGLTAFCARRGLALLVDEVFADYALEPVPGTLPTVLEAGEAPCPVFLLSGLSKIAALPQVKLGWMLLKGPARAYREPLAFLADQYLSVSASAAVAAPALLALAPALQAQIKARLRANLAALDAALRAHPGLSRLPVEGGWSVLLRRPAVDDDEACTLRLLREQHLVVQPGHFFDIPSEGYLVLSLLTPEDAWEKGLARLLPAL